MENLALFVLTTILYYAIWSTLINNANTATDFKEESKSLAVIALLCLPLNINGNVFTVFGNASSSKNIYSVFSIYEKAEVDAFSVFGGLQQKAGHDAAVIIGF